MKKNAFYIIGFIGIISISSISYYFLNLNGPRIERIDRLKKSKKKSILDFSAFKNYKDFNGLTPDAIDINEAIYYFKERYGSKINNRGVQISFIENLIAYFKERYPDNWIDYLYAMIRAVFPDLADEIFETFENRHEYVKWFDVNSEDLNQLSRKERKEKLRTKREEIFGKEAVEDIWEAEIKNDRIYNSLEKINEVKNSALEGRLAMYHRAIDEVYKDESDKFIKNRNHQLMNSFLNLDAVQEDLNKMGPEDRKGSLKTIRKSMGMDVAALKRWENLDQKRDQRWENGSKYMQEREDIVNVYEGVRREQKIDEIREFYFGLEASSIKEEEESGFFRFNRKRRYGMR